MLGKLMKVLLVLTSLAPVCITFWFTEISKDWVLIRGWHFFVIAVLMVGLCLLTMHISKNHLEIIPVQIKSISTSDKEVVAFFVVYLLPLVNESAFQVDLRILCFVFTLFFVSILTTNSYHFNPILGLFGFHFYEVTIDGGITYVLITKKSLTNTRSVQKVVQLSEYMILDVS